MDSLPKGKVVLSAKVDRWMMGIFKVVIWIIIAALFVGIFYSANFARGLYILEPDAMDYAQVARHNLAGEWFQTSFIRPLTFWVTDCSKNVPDLSNPPLSKPLPFSTRRRALSTSPSETGIPKRVAS